MSQEESILTKPSRPRSRAANRDHQPTATQLARLGIKVKDFAYESTLPPVRTVYRQPRQIQPSVPRQLHREDTEPLDGIQPGPSDTRPALGRTVTEPVLQEAGPSIAREMGGYLEMNGSTDRIVNSKSYRLHPATPEYSQVILASQKMKTIVSTPTVTPNGSLQWEEPPTFHERSTSPVMLSPIHRSLSGFSSPLTPLPPSPPTRSSSVLSNRSPSMSIQEPYPKRRKTDHTNSRPGLKRYYLRKRPATHVPSKRFQPAARSPASSLSRTASVNSDRLRTNGIESGSPSSRPLGDGRSGHRRS